ncbi:hypothetical protein [Metabacillus arenae]|uniref:Uncharacterized protein n=1 Tax=Metabacillus arenae TaxID=2771434 RepID=A0A926RX27_9BACI|nr:hypothetical protein [Metabacillus arenae]MBD1379727.1 hypothetical protein [Metabacillus arenae]
MYFHYYPKQPDEEFSLAFDTNTWHDRYEVYVNDNYVGLKKLLSVSEKITDLEDFLHSEGFKRFDTHLEGDHYMIHTSEGMNGLTDALKVYLQTR